MTKLNESRRVACPYVRARAYLHEALEEAPQIPLPLLMQLTAHIPGTGIDLTKDVRVEYSHASDAMHFDEPWHVQWIPEPGGVYPSFEGELTVRADEDYTSALLELAGSYQPPFGTAGRAFDAALGRRIAAATAQSLLAGIAGEMEERYAREEATKSAPRP